MLVVAYMRYSSENQRDGYSIEAQQKAIREYCERKGWTIVHEYIDEAKTGTNDNREHFQEMISDASKGDFNGVVVHKFDRFSRDKYDNAIYKRELRNYGIRVYSVLEELDDSPESLILETLLEGMAQYYSENLAREVKKGLGVKARKGEWCGGQPPYGYRNDKETGKLYIVPGEAEYVRLMFNLYADGKAVSEIVEELKNAGAKTKLSKKRGGGDFTAPTVRSILANEKYTGTFVYRKRKRIKTRTGSKYIPQKNEDVIVVEEALPRIIDDETFAIVQGRLRSSTYNTSRAKVDYMLTGLMFCGECGAEYVGGGSVCRKNKNGTEVRYNYYICSNKKKDHSCKSSQISKERIEQACIRGIIDYCYNDNSIRLFADEYQNWVKNSDSETKTLIEQYKAELKKLESQKARLVSLALDGILSPIETREQKENIERKMALLEPKLRSLQERFVPTKKELIEFMEYTRQKLIDGTYDDYEELLRMHIQKVEIFPDHQVITLIKVPYLTTPQSNFEQGGEPLKTVSDNKSFSFPLYKQLWFLYLLYPLSWAITFVIGAVWLFVVIKRDEKKQAARTLLAE